MKRSSALTAVSDKKRTAPLSFRLDPITREQLDDLAEKAGVSPSEFARNLLAEALSEHSELATLRMKLTSVEVEVKALREDLAVAVKALLVLQGSGHKVTAEQAEEWVEANMHSFEDRIGFIEVSGKSAALYTSPAHYDTWGG
jgi:uncharacterized protein YyaL (SSP411 family)